MSGLTKEQRAAILDDAVEGGEPIDLPVDDTKKPPPPPTPKPPLTEPKVVPPPPETPPPPAPDPMAFIKMLTDAMTASSTVAAQAARNPIPETYLQGGYNEKSVYSNPEGDLVRPREKLKCPIWMGTYSDTGETKPAIEILEDVCTPDERRMLNLLTPGSFRVERNDGVSAQWKVVLQSDDLGTPIRLIIALPARWLTKEHQAMNPGQPSFLRQLTQPVA
jgi:hypothetical protein